MKRWAVYLDSSVLIAGILSKKGASFAAFELLRLGKIVGFFSSEILQEVLHNLDAKIGRGAVEDFLLFLSLGVLIKVKISERDILRFTGTCHEKDTHVLAGAAKAGSNFLLTLDQKHLLSLDDSTLPFKIVTPGTFIKIFLNEESQWSG